MNSPGFSLPSCGILIYIIIAFAGVWIGSTVRRLPADISGLREEYHSQNWMDLYVRLSEVGFYWLTSLFAGVFIYASFTMPAREYG